MRTALPSFAAGLNLTLRDWRDAEARRIVAAVSATQAMGNDTSHADGEAAEDAASRIVFELERDAGQRISMWFELVAAARPAD